MTMRLSCRVREIRDLKRFGGHDFDLLGSRDVISHLTIRLGVGTFLLVVNDNHASILHGCGDTEPRRFWGHDLDLLWPRDVIGHVTIGLGICGFLLVVHCNHASNLHRYGDIRPQSCICPSYKGQKFTSHTPIPVERPLLKPNGYKSTSSIDSV